MQWVLGWIMSLKDEIKNVTLCYLKETALKLVFKVVKNLLFKKICFKDKSDANLWIKSV